MSVTLEMSPDGDSKKRISVIMWGTSGSGKTSLVNEWATKALLAGRPVIIVDKNGQFLHLGDDVSVQVPFDTLADGSFIEELLASGWRGLLILDDIDAYLDGKGKIPKAWSELFSSNRHYRIDLVINARRPQETPKMLLSVARYLAIFYNRGDARMRAALEAELAGMPDVLKAIPTEPYHYLLVDRETGEFSRHKTIRLPPEAE
jgi:GTPase SAR1 family protein